ncbi:hypothetical protein EPO56_01995 [Patescibacteria group bacterium]|nr:MAG: hypothetical protein EPO56_01995 [Patescibacteria group bacterium]
MTPYKPISARPPKVVLILISTTLAIIIGYSVYAAFPFLEGPSLKVKAVASDNNSTLIQGVTKRVSYLDINGKAISIGEDGLFSAERTYPTGYNGITVTARDRFGRSITKELSILVTNNQHTEATTTYAKKENI